MSRRFCLLLCVVLLQSSCGSRRSEGPSSDQTTPQTAGPTQADTQVAELQAKITKWQANRDRLKQLMGQLEKDKTGILGKLLELGVESDSDLANNPKGQVLYGELKDIVKQITLYDKKFQDYDLAILKSESRVRSIARQLSAREAGVSDTELEELTRSMVTLDESLASEKEPAVPIDLEDTLKDELAHYQKDQTTRQQEDVEAAVIYVDITPSDAKLSATGNGIEVKGVAQSRMITVKFPNERDSYTVLAMRDGYEPFTKDYRLSKGQKEFLKIALAQHQPGSNKAIGQQRESDKKPKEAATQASSFHAEVATTKGNPESPKSLQPSTVRAKGKSESVSPTWTTCDGYPWIAGIWRMKTGGNHVGETVVIVQGKESLTASFRDKDDKVLWRLNGVISKDGHLKANVVYTDGSDKNSTADLSGHDRDLKLHFSPGNIEWTLEEPQAVPTPQSSAAVATDPTAGGEAEKYSPRHENDRIPTKKNKPASRHVGESPDALNKIVSLAPPYPQTYPQAPTDKMSVQYAVMALVEQAGLGYDFNESLKNTDPICRRWVRPNIQRQPCKKALEAMLTPVGLSYEIRNGKVVLKRR